LGPLELGYLTFGFASGNPITLLNFAHKLIALRFHDLPVIIGQAAPLLLGFPG
jgi:hypothetical protein